MQSPTSQTDPVDAAAAAITARSSLAPKMALVLGSGLGSVAAQVEASETISYEDIPGFPRPTVAGHAGRMLMGTLGGLPLVCLSGRVHPYEGDTATTTKTFVRTLKAIGVETLVLTNAAGSLRPFMEPGQIVSIADHINLMNSNPLVGPNDNRWGPRFVGMDDAWDPELRETLLAAAADAQTTLREGVYVGLRGPAFETPQEIRMLIRCGGDMVGMSTIPENIVARHCGLKVVGISAITNLGCGLSPIPLSHAQTLEGAKLADGKVAKVVTAFAKRLAQAT